jgi:hypothetical protein
MSVKFNDEHQVLWRAPQVGRLLVFRGVQNREVSPAASMDGFTPARTTSNDPRLPYETISLSLQRISALRAGPIAIYRIFAKIDRHRDCAT